MPFWTEKSPHLRGAVVNFVVTRKIERFARPHLQNPNLYKGSKLQLQLRGQSLFKILQTLSVKTPHLGSDDKSDDTLEAPTLQTMGQKGGELWLTKPLSR
jgi:hypothetical protein